MTCIDIPQLQSAPTLVSSTNTIIVSWSPTQFTPDSYKIFYSCRLICGSSVTQQTVTVDGSLTTNTIMVDFGSTCSAHVEADFGGSIISNLVPSNSINTTSAGMVYDNTSIVFIHVCLLPSPYWCPCICSTHEYISGEEVTECSVGDSTLPTPERTHHWIQTALQQWYLRCEHYRRGEQTVYVDWTDSIH